MAGDMMNVHYAAVGTAATPTWQFTPTQTYQPDSYVIDLPPLQQAMQKQAVIRAAALTQPKPQPAVPARRKIVAKLIRFTVVDPEPVLARERPDLCIILEGRRMLNGTDDKGFLMDLAPEVAKKLDAHNEARTKVEYDDDEGNSKTLKAVRLGQLDVVVEMLKEYAE